MPLLGKFPQMSSDFIKVIGSEFEVCQILFTQTNGAIAHQAMEVLIHLMHLRRL